jgi:hypothetical protein
MFGNVGRVTGVLTVSETDCNGVIVTDGVKEGVGVFVGVGAIGAHWIEYGLSPI